MHTFILLIVVDPQGILDQHLRPHPIHYQTLLLLLLLFELVILKYIIIKLLINLKNEDHPGANVIKRFFDCNLLIFVIS